MAIHECSALTQLTDMTECCICLKTFTDPRMLPCIHTFCFQCINEMVDKSDKKPGDEIQCPMCRKEFTLPNDGVQGIQKNFFMAGMVAVRNALNQSKLADIPCDVCKTNTDGAESNISKATLRCLECQENLCEECCKMHKAFKVSRNHKVLKIDGEVGEEEAVKNLNVMNCDIHLGKILDYYCAECKKVVCVSCFVESHKAHDCKDVNTVGKEFRQVIKSCSDKISALVGELLAKKEKSERKENFLTKIAAREKEIMQRSDELKKAVDEHTKSLLSSLDEIKNRRLKEIQAREDELERNLIIVESFKRYCDELSSKGSASDVCRNKDELLRRADELEEDHEMYIMRQPVSYDLTFLATDLNGNVIGTLEEKYLEASAVMIRPRNDGSGLSTYKINLYCKNGNVSPIKDVPPKVRSFPAAAVYNNTLFITGIGRKFCEIWKYNFEPGWSKCGSLVLSRQHHCAEFIGETLYICGGTEVYLPNLSFLIRMPRGAVTSHIETYNAVTQKSRVDGQLRFCSKLAVCVAYKGSIYVFGGEDNDQKWLNCVQVFNTVEKTCTLLSTPIPRPTAHWRVLSWNAYAIFPDTNAWFFFDLDNRTWEERKQFRMGAGADYFGVVLENERIFIIDGSLLNPGVNDGQNKCDIMYIRSSSILKDEAPTCRRPYGQLPQPFDVVAIPKLTLVK